MMLDRPRLDIRDETYLLQSCAMGIKKQTNKQTPPSHKRYVSFSTRYFLVFEILTTLVIELKF